jgi:hypothetical protein
VGYWIKVDTGSRSLRCPSGSGPAKATGKRRYRFELWCVSAVARVAVLIV